MRAAFEVASDIMRQPGDLLRESIDRLAERRVAFGVPERFRTDNGRLLQRTPAVVVRAAAERDAVAAVRAAALHGLPVVARGAGHSCGGQAVTDGVLVAGVARAGRGVSLDANGDALVSARGLWRDVEFAVNRAGRSMPVLADYLNLSVGGTLSVGGYGVDSIAHGALVDHVVRLRVILPDGTVRWCSPAEDGARFGLVLAGLGRSGVIEQAVVRTVPHRRYTVLFSYEHRSLAELVASTAWMASSAPGELPQVFKAFHAQGRYVSAYGARAASLRDALEAAPPPAVASRSCKRRLVCPDYRRVRSLAVAAWSRRYQRHRKIWCDYFLDTAGLARFERVIAELRASDGFAGSLRNVYLLAVRKMPRAVPMPFEACGGIEAPVTFGIGLYCMIAPRHLDRVRAIEQAMARCLDACVALGGRPYLYGSHRLTRTLGERLYGEAFQYLADDRAGVAPAPGASSEFVGVA